MRFTGTVLASCFLAGCAVTGSEDVWFDMPSSYRPDNREYISEQADIRCKGKVMICHATSTLSDQWCTCYP